MVKQLVFSVLLVLKAGQFHTIAAGGFYVMCGTVEYLAPNEKLAMAILILGQSTCGICNKKIATREEACSFPSFISTAKSKHRKFSGNNFHIDCFRRDKAAPDIAGLLNAFRSATSPGTRVCAIDGLPIGKDEEYVFIEYVTDDERNFLRRNVYKNYRTAHLHNWLELPLLISAFDDLTRGEKHLREYAYAQLKKIHDGVERSRKKEREESAVVARYEFIFPGLSASKVRSYFAAEKTVKGWVENRLSDIISTCSTFGFVDSVVFESGELIRKVTNAHEDAYEALLQEVQKTSDQRTFQCVKISLSPDAVSESVLVVELFCSMSQTPYYLVRTYNSNSVLSVLTDKLADKLNSRKQNQK